MKPANQAVITRQQQSLSIHQGPIPAPETLAKYEALVPGAAQLLISQVVKQTDHRIAIETKVINSDIFNSKLGLFFGFIVAMTALIISGISIYYGREWSGGFIGTGSLVGLVSVFVYGSIQRRKEREKNANQIKA